MGRSDLVESRFDLFYENEKLNLSVGLEDPKSCGGCFFWVLKIPQPAFCELLFFLKKKISLSKRPLKKKKSRLLKQILVKGTFFFQTLRTIEQVRR